VTRVAGKGVGEKGRGRGRGRGEEGKLRGRQEERSGGEISEKLQVPENRVASS
jgi:hypothetical protein